jgi:hypothetical protein
MNNVTKLTTLGLIGTLAIGSIAAFAANNPATTQALQNVQTALTYRDFGAYKTAEIALATERVNGMTQDQFNAKADKYTQIKGVQDAVEKNDYEAFKKVAGQKMLQKVDSQEKFNKLVEANKTRTEYEAKVAETIKNNDFNAFKELEANRPNPVGKERRAKRTPTDEQLQNRFNKMVEAYKTNGMLPGKADGLIGADYFGNFGFKGGRRGHRGMGSEMMSEDKVNPEIPDTSTGSQN